MNNYNFTITVRAWNSECDPGEVIEHVAGLVRDGFTSGYDLGIHWQIKDDPPKEEAEKPAEAIPANDSALDALHGLSALFDAPLRKYGGITEDRLRDARAVLRKAKRAGWTPATKKARKR